MSSFAALEIGKRALQSNYFGIDVTSNNVANSATEGYSRRQAIQSEANPYNKYGLFVGTGVNMESMRSFRQEYLDREVRNANARNSGYEMDVLFYNSVETIMKEPTDTNIGELINQLLYSFDEVSLQPEVIGLRENLLSISQTFVERLNSTSNEFLSMRRQANTDLINQVDEANKLIDVITDYNKAIAIAKDPSGNDALTYIDKREVAIEKLSKLGNVTVTSEDTGLANVYINGINVVTGVSKQNLKVQENINEATGESNLDVVTYNSQKDLTISINPASGKMAASLKQYNVLLDPADSSGGFSIMQTLDRYANTFAETVNSIFATGYGLNDLTEPASGRVMFESTSGEAITAGNIKVSESISDPADIPLSATAGTPGNADIALQVSRILQNGNFLEGQAPIEFYSNFIGKISQNANEATNALASSNLVIEHLDSTRNSIMGVNLDEEGINLIKFQKNLEAASRIVATTSEVLSTIVNLGR
jgi:flagellar hook-associated protein 1 FlgK